MRAVISGSKSYLVLKFVCFLLLLFFLLFFFFLFWFPLGSAGPHSAVSSASDSGPRGSGFDTRIDHLLSFLLSRNKTGSCQLRAKACALITG